MVDCLLLLVMSYISFCVFYALFKLKFSSFYGLYWNQQTDSASLIFYSMYFCHNLETVREFQHRFATISYKSFIRMKELLSLRSWEPISLAQCSDRLSTSCFQSYWFYWFFSMLWTFIGSLQKDLEWKSFNSKPILNIKTSIKVRGFWEKPEPILKPRF